jgi:hypothetical protein
VSDWTVARNGLLACVALLVVARGPGASFPFVLELVIVAAVAAGAVWLSERRAPAADEPAPRPPTPPDRRGLPRGAVAPDFELGGPCDGPASLASLRARGVPVVLLFLDAGCGSCRELHPHLRRWQLALAERLSIAVVMTGAAEGAQALCTDHGVRNVLVDDGDEPLWSTYLMPGTPSGVAVSPDGLVASPAVRGPDALEELVRQTVRHGAQTEDAWKQPSPVG